VANVASAPSLQAILRDHARRYPRWNEFDLYKLMHQAELGSEHTLTDGRAAGQWLERELAHLGPGPVEPLFDPIRADGQLVRIHLRPWLEKGLDPAALLEAFQQTARQWQGSSTALEAALHSAESLAEELGLPAKAVAKCAARMKPLGFPPVHHSRTFEAEYRPAYRVVAVSFFPDGLLAGLLG
jgi:hypothetical protein